MVVVYPSSVVNTNPVLGPIQGNKQSIGIYDSKLGNSRILIATPEECDEFIDNRQIALKQNGKRTLKTLLVSTVAGSGIGSGVGAAVGKLETDKINRIVDRLNKNISKSGAFVDLRTMYPKHWFKLESLFDNTKKIYKKMGNSRVKELAASGAIIGLLASLPIGSIYAGIKGNKAIEKLSRAFIDKHSKAE